MSAEIKCVRVGCTNIVPPPKIASRPRRFCSSACWGAVAYGDAETEDGEPVVVERAPQKAPEYEQHPIGACARCRRERWLYALKGDDDKRCGPCTIKKAHPAKSERAERALAVSSQ